MTADTPTADNGPADETGQTAIERLTVDRDEWMREAMIQTDRAAGLRAELPATMLEPTSFDDTDEDDTLYCPPGLMPVRGYLLVMEELAKVRADRDRLAAELERVGHHHKVLGIEYTAAIEKIMLLSAELAASESDRTWLRGLHAVEVGKSVSLEAENAELRAVVERLLRVEQALSWLVRLKDGPRNAHYHEVKPDAWAEARAALAATLVPVSEQAPADWCPECSEGGEPGRCEPGTCPGRPYPEAVSVPDRPAGDEPVTAGMLRGMAAELDRATFASRSQRLQAVKDVAADLRSLADLVPDRPGTPPAPAPIRLCTRLIPHDPHASEDHRGAFGCPGIRAEPDEEVVEHCARAAWSAHNPDLIESVWSTPAAEPARQWFRRVARAVLASAPATASPVERVGDEAEPATLPPRPWQVRDSRVLDANGVELFLVHNVQRWEQDLVARWIVHVVNASVPAPALERREGP